MTSVSRLAARMSLDSWRTVSTRWLKSYIRSKSMRRQLIGDVSHELRTPLTAIKGSMEGLMDGVLPANDETYQQIHQEADRLNRLVDDLQELSRVEAGAYELDLRPTNLAPLLETLTKRFRQPFETKRVGLNLDLPADLPPVLGRRAPSPASADQPDRQCPDVHA